MSNSLQATGFLKTVHLPDGTTVKVRLYLDCGAIIDSLAWKAAYSNGGKSCVLHGAVEARVEKA